MASVGNVLQIAGGFVGDAFNVSGAYNAINVSQDEGDHIAVSLTKGVGTFAVGEIFYGSAAANFGFAGSLGVSAGAMAAMTAMNLSAQHMKNTAEVLGSAAREEKGIGSGSFNMTETGYTMRQRSLNAIRSNGANINSAFGNEARNYYLGL